MPNIQDIENGELGSSVRSKLNEVIANVNLGAVVSSVIRNGDPTIVPENSIVTILYNPGETGIADPTLPFSNDPFFVTIYIETFVETRINIQQPDYTNDPDGFTIQDVFTGSFGSTFGSNIIPLDGDRAAKVVVFHEQKTTGNPHRFVILESQNLDTP